MAGIGMTDIGIVLVGVLVIFGAGKLPEVMRSLGQGVREMREITRDGDTSNDDYPSIDTG